MEKSNKIIFVVILALVLTSCASREVPEERIESEINLKEGTHNFVLETQNPENTLEAFELIYKIAWLLFSSSLIWAIVLTIKILTNYKIKKLEIKRSSTKNIYK